MTDTDDTTRLFAPELEGAVLGCVTLFLTEQIHHEAQRKALLMLEPDDFGDPQYRRCWATVQRLAKEGAPVDPNTVAEVTGKTSVEVSEIFNRIVNATNHVGTPLYVEWYAQKVLQKAMARRALEAAKEFEAQTIRSGGEIGDGGAALKAAIDEAAMTRAAKPVTVGSLALEALDRLEAGKSAPRIETGIRALDGSLGGLVAGNLCVLAARPGVGKTALALQVAANAARRGHPVVVLSLEMSGEEVMHRWLSHVGQVDHGAIRTGQVRQLWRELDGAASVIRSWPAVVKTDARTLHDIELACRRWRAASNASLSGEDPKPGLIVLDYLQLVRCRAETREREVAEVSRTMKLLAGDLDCAVMALSQLSRGSEKEVRRPRLSDLRDSGAIEQDADMVLFLRRRAQESEGDAVLEVAKHRGGRLGKIALDWVGRIQTFGNSDRVISDDEEEGML